MGKPVNSTLVKEIMALEVYTAVRHLSRYAPGDVYHPATVRGVGPSMVTHLPFKPS